MIEPAASGTGLDRLLDRAPVRLGLYALLALAAVWPFLDGAGGLNDFRDAHILATYERDAAASVLDHGQLPLWDPYYCGGVYALGSPQTRFASPTFGLTLALGVERAEPVIAWLLLLAGMEGMFRLVRGGTRRAWTAFLVAPAFALNGQFAASFFRGWINFFGFELVPWTLLGVRQALAGRAAGLLPAAGGFALMTGFGGTYAVPLTALMAGLDALRSVVEGATARDRGERLGRVALAFALVGLLSAALSAFRLWPVAETLAAAPRIMAGEPSDGATVLAGRLLRFLHPAGRSVGRDGSFFLGPWLVPLVLLGVTRRRAWWAAGFALLALWTATGYASPYGPFPGLRLLPVLETLRYPERFLLLVAFYAVEVAAQGLDTLADWGARRGWARSLAALGLVVVVANTGTALWNFRAAGLKVPRAAPPAPTTVAPEAFRQARGNRWVLSYYAPLELGSLSCMESWPVPQSPLLRGDLPAEEYLEPREAGTVGRRHWSPARLDLRAEMARPGRLIVNQNHHPGWKSSVGAVVSHQGLLAVDLPPGTHDVVLTFRPRSALGGHLVSLAALASLVVVVRRARRRPDRPWPLADRATLAAVLLPGAVLSAVVGLVPEPGAARQPLRNPNGRLAVLDQVPPEATPLDVRFELPVRLVGAYVPPRVEPEQVATVELYWRVTGPVPRSVGVFVHAERRGAKRVQADHEVLAGSLFLKDAPRDRVIRDAFVVDLTNRKSGAFNLYVGLWSASGDGERVDVTLARGARARADRVRVGVIHRLGPPAVCPPDCSTPADVFPGEDGRSEP